MTKGAARISIILPVLNEAAEMNGLINGLRAQTGADRAEIIVVDGDPKGGTIAVIEGSGVVTAVAPRGRASQMNHGASLATGDIFLFLHADTLLPPNALPQISAHMSTGHCAAGAFDLGIGSPRCIFRITERYVALRSRLTRIPFGDQALFIDRKYFFAIGGYRDLPLMEDVEIMKRIKKRGDRICIIPDKVMTSARRWEKEGIIACTLRNWTLQAAYALGVPPERLAKWYRSHND